MRALPLRPPPRRARGFTMAELMIAITLGLLLLAGMTTLFVNNSRAQGEIEKANRQLENGRFGIELLSRDLGHAGFYGEFDPGALSAPAALPDPCATTLAELNAALPLHMQGYDGVAGGLPACLDDVRADTDVVVTRHTASCQSGVGDCAADGPFFQASLCNNLSELGSSDPGDFYALDTSAAALTRHRRDCTSVAGSGTLAPIRRFETHIYFVANNDRAGDGIPTLKRAELGASGDALGISIVPLVEGIENLQIEYGVDTGADGSADVFTADPNTLAGCATAPCAIDNWRKVVSVKLNLLARNTAPSNGYTDTRSYTLGVKADGGANVVAAANDHYKRHVFQAVVGLPNPAGRMAP